MQRLWDKHLYIRAKGNKASLHSCSGHYLLILKSKPVGKYKCSFPSKPLSLYGSKREPPLKDECDKQNALYNCYFVFP